MKALLWDLDDTLLNTAPARMKALGHAHEVCLGTRTDPWALWVSHRGGSLEALAQRLMGAEGPRFVKAYREYYYGLPGRAPAFDGIGEVLAACHDGGIKMAVVTQKISWGATDELEAAGLLRYFAAIVGVDDVEHHKPDPEPVFAAMDRLLVTEPADVALVGDSPADIFAARNAGCTSIAALWGMLDMELTLDAAPDYTARTPGDILDVLEVRLSGAGR
ncbi:MAG: HAD-IA family hydrolase [Dehalococcoidia bacterium]|nr:HAD-IA family hydrolase [Dehalococcoidia bacterium]